MQKNIRAPSGLSPEARKWWRKIRTEYAIDDPGGLLILQALCEAFDTMREAQKILKADGMRVVDRFGQVKSNPLCAVQRDARAQVLAGLKALNLDIEPLKAIGRPGGS
jgi:P27 family predicted phage terminase small subunit